MKMARFFLHLEGATFGAVIWFLIFTIRLLSDVGKKISFTLSQAKLIKIFGQDI